MLSYAVFLFVCFYQANIVVNKKIVKKFIQIEYTCLFRHNIAVRTLK